MTQPRRAALDDAVDAGVDVGIRSQTPRRGRGGRLRRQVSRSMAPLAVTALVVGTTILTFVPIADDGRRDVADPMLHAEVQLGVSRHREREPLATPSPTATRTTAPATATPTPAASSPAAATPTPVPAATEPAATAPPEAATAPEPAASTPAPSVAAPPTPEAVAAEPTPTPSAEPSAAPDHSVLAEATGTLHATAAVNVRTGPGTDHEVIATLAPGAAVTATAATAEDWQQVDVDGTAGWIKADYLSATPPAPQPAAPSGPDTSPCARGADIEGGLTDRAVGVLRAVCNEFENLHDFGGRRSGGGSYHSSGRAIDVMVSGEAGWEVARYVRSNARALGVTEVIYAQKIWTSQRSGEGWRGMSDRGSVSANHYDHVHISVR